MKNKKFIIAISMCLLFALGVKIINLPFNNEGLIIKAYAEENFNLENDDSYVEMKLNAKVLIESYSPLMSSVPGMPFEISYEGAEINISVDKGNILYWDGSKEGDSKVYNQGKNCTFNDSHKIYWSPSYDEDGNKGIMTIEVIKNEKIVEEAIIQYIEDDYKYYAILLRK
ncbi:MAG: hypothetical protein ACI33J_11315 [Clostridium sp.]